MEPPCTAVLGVAAALDQSRFFQAVDDPAQGNRLDIKVIGELDLAKSGFAPKPRQGAKNTGMCASEQAKQ